MKKYILILLTGAVLLPAQPLTIEQMATLQNYSHSLSGKLRYKKRLKKIANLDKREAFKRAKAVCKEDIQQSKLMKHSDRIFYKISTETCSIRIDALDGSIIK